MAGQIVMEGFLNFRMRPWLRRLITRAVAVIPAAITISIAGDEGTYQLLILSQVILSMQLPFAVIPLIHFTSDRARMGEFANRKWVKLLAWTAAIIIVGLNLRLAATTIGEWLGEAGDARIWILLFVVPVVATILGLLVYVIVQPFLPRWRIRIGRAPVTLPASVGSDLQEAVYKRILVPLDHTALDRKAIAHAAALARQHKAKLYLLHVEEDVTSQVYGQLSQTAEVEAGREYLTEITSRLRDQGIETEILVSYSRKPHEEIIRHARELKPDLLVMGAHGHKGFKDLVLGTTISSVRHNLDIPLLIVQREK
jgi:manganese transport protein